MKKYLMLLAIATPLMIGSPAQAQVNFSDTLQAQNYMPSLGYHDQPSDSSDFFNSQYSGSSSPQRSSSDELMRKQYERWLWKGGFIFFLGFLNALVNKK